MSTRGLYGFRKNGIDKASYNHYDSYPEGLGKIIVEFLSTTSSEELNEMFEKIILVDQYDEPSETEQAEIKRMNIYNGEYKDWYSILHNYQGNPELLRETINEYGKAYMTDDISFIKDSLFCEYAYIINLDDSTLEFWNGFQRTPTENRYGNNTDDDRYYTCKLLMSIPLQHITEKRINADAIVEMMNELAKIDDEENGD